MGFTLHYFEVVKLDIIEAKDWYKRQKVGLEKDFAAEVKRCIQNLGRNPLGY